MRYTRRIPGFSFSIHLLTIFFMFSFIIMIDNLFHVVIHYSDWQALSCFRLLLWLTSFVIFSFIIMIDNLDIFSFIYCCMFKIFFIRNFFFRTLMSQRENPRWCIFHPSSNPSLVNPCSSILRSITSRCRPWSPSLEDKKEDRRPGSEAGSLVGEINNCFVIIKFD